MNTLRTEKLLRYIYIMLDFLAGDGSIVVQQSPFKRRPAERRGCCVCLINNGIKWMFLKYLLLQLSAWIILYFRTAMCTKLVNFVFIPPIWLFIFHSIIYFPLFFLSFLSVDPPVLSPFMPYFALFFLPFTIPSFTSFAPIFLYLSTF